MWPLSAFYIDSRDLNLIAHKISLPIKPLSQLVGFEVGFSQINLLISPNCFCFAVGSSDQNLMGVVFEEIVSIHF